MKILFNCIVNREGGAIQNAANFISNAYADGGHEYFFIVSEAVYEVIIAWNCVDERVLVVGHPLYNSDTRSSVAKLEIEFQPDIVYTMAGPSYIKFKSFHVLGISDGYITHADLDVFFYGRSFLEGVKHLFKTILKGLLSRREGNGYIFQTETSRQGYCSRYFLKAKKTRVVPNALGRSFGSSNLRLQKHSAAADRKCYILCPSSDYSHKDLYIIKRIAKLVSEDITEAKGVELIFYVTVARNSPFAALINEINAASPLVQVVNKGPYLYSDASEVYADCDVVFMPSVLETFSTSYLEALAAGKALVVADKAFSREICGNAAVYFTPKNAKSALKCILKVRCSAASDVMHSYSAVLDKYGEYEGRYNQIIRSLQVLRFGEC